MTKQELKEAGEALNHHLENGTFEFFVEGGGDTALLEKLASWLMREERAQNDRSAK